MFREGLRGRGFGVGDFEDIAKELIREMREVVDSRGRLRRREVNQLDR